MTESNQPPNFHLKRYTVADAQARKDWSELLGVQVCSNEVLVPYPAWMEYRNEIAAIQLASALRRLEP